LSTTAAELLSFRSWGLSAEHQQKKNFQVNGWDADSLKDPRSFVNLGLCWVPAECTGRSLWSWGWLATSRIQLQWLGDPVPWQMDFVWGEDLPTSRATDGSEEWAESQTCFWILPEV